MREIRKGKRFISVHGEMYQHHDVWISFFEEWVINKIATKTDMDENHVIGKIVEEWVGKNTNVMERIDFYKIVTLPKIREKWAEKNKTIIVQEEKKDGESGGKDRTDTQVIP